jgi:hypothetical protein
MPVPDFSPGEVLTAAAMDSIGLWKVVSGNATTGTVLSISNCFTADYDAFRIVITDARCTPGATTIGVRLRNSGGQINTNYSWQYRNSSYATTTSYSQQGATGSTSFSALGGVTDPSGGGGTAFDVFNPFSSSNKTVVAGTRTDPRTVGAGGDYIGFHDVAESITGIDFLLNAGTIVNLTATIYGYRK